VTETIYQEDFEGDDGGYLVTGENWEWGTPTSGPQGAHSGEYVWATNLEGNYSSSADARLETPLIDLTGVLNPQLSFWHWFSFEHRAANYDGGNVKVSCDGGEFQIIEPLNGYEGIIASNNAGIPNEPGFCSYEYGQFWHQEVFDLSPFAGRQIVIRFHMGSNSRYTYPGWYIDDVAITGTQSSCSMPEIVSDFSVDLSGDDILLTWSWACDDDPAGFIIYRGSWFGGHMTDPESLTVVNGTSYLDQDMAGNPDNNCFYQIRVQSSDGEQMEPSQVVGEFDVPLRNSPAQ
jgi:bacillopeptidase F